MMYEEESCEEEGKDLPPCFYFHSALPTPSITSFNPNGLSAYANNNHSRKRKYAMLENIRKLAERDDIICLQETHLLCRDIKYLKYQFPKWEIVYNNYNQHKWGVLIMYKEELLNHYSPMIHQFPYEMQGRGLAITFESLDPHNQDFRVTNLYLPSGADWAAKRKVLSHINNLPRTKYHLLQGDFNFVERGEDTSTQTDYYNIPKHFADAWGDFCDRHSLREVNADSHTRFQICKDVTQSKSAKLDRFYTSYSDAELNLLIPTIIIPHVPYSLFTNHNTTDVINMKHTNPHLNSNNQPIKRITSDHIPIRINLKTITTTNNEENRESREKFPSIPKWLPNDQRFTTIFDYLWANNLDSRGVNGDPFERWELMEITMQETARKLLEFRKQENIVAATGPHRLATLLSILKLTVTNNNHNTHFHKLVLSLKHKHSLSLVQARNASHVESRINTMLANLDYNQANEFSFDRESLVSHAPSPHKHENPHNTKKALNYWEQLNMILPNERKRLAGLRKTATSQIFTDPEGMASIATPYYKELWRHHERMSSQRSPAQYLSFYRKTIAIRNKPRLPTISQAIGVINGSGNSTAGPDGIPFAALRASTANVAPVLLAVFYALAQGRLPPANFNQGLLFLLPKKDTLLPIDTRPITVNNSFNRLVAKLAVESIIDAVVAGIEQEQKGCLKGRQGTDIVRKLYNVFYSSVNNPKLPNYFILSLDVKKAFDTVAHDFLKETIRKFGLPAWFSNLVEGLLHKAKVTPFLGNRVDIWISLERGVKQGCPLSPILFIIVYDSLVCKLKHHDGADIYVYADDMRIGTIKLSVFNNLMYDIDEFGEISLLKQNWSKLLIIAARNGRNDKRAINRWISTCKWRDHLKLKDQDLVLGFLIGHKIESEHVFATPVDKLIKRAASYAPIMKTLSHNKRVTIWNAKIITLLEYVGSVVAFPFESLGADIRRAARYCIIPWHTGHAYVQLLGPTGITTLPLVRDFYAWNQATLAARVDLSTYDGMEIIPSQNAIMTSEAMETAAAADFVTRQLALSWDNIQWDSNTLGDSALNTPKRRREIYQKMVVGLYSYQEQEPLLMKVMERRLLHNPTIALNQLTTNFNSLWKHLPKTTQHIQFSLTFNTLRTKRRLMVIDYPLKIIRDRIPRESCFRCGLEDDGIMHLGECAVIKLALRAFSVNIKVNLNTIYLRAHSLHDVLFLNFPNNPNAANAIACFNKISWFQTRDFFQYFSSRPVIAEAAGRIADEASRDFIFLQDRKKKKKTSTSAYGSAGKRTQAQVEACNEYARGIMASLPANCIVAATDGACLGNPGPAGAGAYIYYPHKPQEGVGSYERELSIAIGEGTNNKGELWGIGATLDTIINDPPCIPHNQPTELHILVDSSYCLGVLTKDWKAQSNTKIIDNININHTKLPSYIVPHYHWVPGHVDLGVNIQADLLATLGAKKSKRGHGLSPDQLKTLIIGGHFLTQHLPPQN